MRSVRGVRAAALVAALVVLAAPAAAPSAVGPFLAGDQTIEGSRDQDQAGTAEAFRVTAAASGTVAFLTVYVDGSSSATSLVAGLYADAGGRPGTLLTNGTLSPVRAAAWNEVAVPDVAITAGASYWLAILAPTNAGRIRFRDRGCCTASQTSLSRTLSALPQTWASGGAAQTVGPVSAFASGAAVTAPILAVAPTTLSFAAVEGGADPAAASLDVANTGAGTLSFAAAAGAPWLAVSPATGTAPQTLAVTASAAGLAAGTYTSQISVTAAGAQGSPATVPVTLTVAAAPPPPPPPPPPSGSATDWPMVDHDPGRTANAVGESTITTATAPQLALRWSSRLDGKITAQPLFVGGVQIGGAARDVVVAATNANSIYALDAGTGATIWRRAFGAVGSNCAIPGGFGITAAPVVDVASGRIYTVSDDGQLRTLSLATGADAAAPQQLIDLPATNKVWGGLELVAGRLYVATASDGCDTPPWRGRVYALDVTGAAPTLLATWVVVGGIAAPNGGGGIWGYGGVSADTATGRVFAATGADSNELYQPHADDIVALDQNASVLGAFAPFHPSSFPCNGAPCDVDFGATPLVFQPSGCPTLVAAGNKDGNLYLLRSDDLATSGPPLQTLQLNGANDWLGNGGVGGVPAYWPGGRMLFVADAGAGIPGIAGGLVGLTIGADCTLQVAWSVPIGGNQQPNSTPTVANGVVFVGVGSGGNVRAFDATTGSLLWDSGPLGGATYAAPIVANGVVYSASWDGTAAGDAGTVRAFALGSAPAPPPPPPPPPPPAGTVLIGDEAIEPQLDQNTMGQAEAFEATASATGTVASLTVYLDAGSTAANVVMGIYADAAGKPGTLVAQGSSATLTAGAWNTIPLSSGAPVVAGAPYWIAILGTTSGTPRFRDRAGGCRSQTSAETALTALPATWTTGTLYTDCPISGYGRSG